MGACVMEEQAISHAQYLDLFYSQSGTLYDLLPDGLRPSSDPTTSKSQATPPFDAVIGSVSQAYAKSFSKQKLA